MVLNYSDLPLHIRRRLEGQDAPTEATEATQERTPPPKARKATRKRKAGRKGTGRVVEAVEAKEGVEVREGVVGGELHRWQWRAMDREGAGLWIATGCALSQRSEPRAAVGTEPRCKGCYKEESGNGESNRV